MVDTDQGGTYRQTARINLGPSIGPIDAQDAVTFVISSGGTVAIPLGYTYIVISTTAVVTINLPKFKGAAAGAIAAPGTYATKEITIADQSGAPNVTINAGAGEFFSNEVSTLSLTLANGVIRLRPDVINGGALKLS